MPMVLVFAKVGWCSEFLMNSHGSCICDNSRLFRHHFKGFFKVKLATKKKKMQYQTKSNSQVFKSKK